jgi:hypothetical protein
MRLIQVYNTFGGKNVTCGFTTFRALIDFWKKSVKRHKKHYDLTIYTDIYGYVDFEALWHVEEIGLANYVEDNNLSLNIFKNYIHLQGGLK